MSDQFWLTKAQLKRIEPFSPRTRGMPRVDDRRVIGGIIYVIQKAATGRSRAPGLFGESRGMETTGNRWRSPARSCSMPCAASLRPTRIKREREAPGIYRY
jgi:hypothetical protein